MIRRLVAFLLALVVVAFLSLSDRPVEHSPTTTTTLGGNP